MNDKLVIVTGASQGIGKALSFECAKRGFSVLLSARSRNQLERTAEEIRATFPSPKIDLFGCDVSNSAQVRALFDHAQKKQIPLHGLICAAGMLGEVGPLGEADLSLWEKTVQTNLMGSMYCAHFAIPLMKENGGGRIVLFSGGGQGPQARRTAYTASKGGIWRFTESLGSELKEDKIYVNAVAPGAVNTKFLEDVLTAGEEKAGKDAYSEALRQKAEGGAGTAPAAKLVAWLLSEKSAGLTGKVLSAQWDEYEKFTDLAKMSASDLFTFKRVINEQGATRWK